VRTDEFPPSAPTSKWVDILCESFVDEFVYVIDTGALLQAAWVESTLDEEKLEVCICFSIPGHKKSTFPD